MSYNAYLGAQCCATYHVYENQGHAAARNGNFGQAAEYFDQAANYRAGANHAYGRTDSGHQKAQYYVEDLRDTCTANTHGYTYGSGNYYRFGW